MANMEYGYGFNLTPVHSITKVSPHLAATANHTNRYSNSIQIPRHRIPHHPRPSRSIRHRCSARQLPDYQIPNRSMGSTKVRTCLRPRNDNIESNVPLRMLLSGLGGIIIIEIYAAVMQREFQHTENRLGKGFAILGIYLFVVAYC